MATLALGRAGRQLLCGSALLLAACNSDSPAGTAKRNPGPEPAPPVADAGADRTVNEGASVTLVGDGRDPDGGAVAFAWRQIRGPSAAELSTHGRTLHFTAPEVAADAALAFELRVTDDEGQSAADEVVVTVRNIGPGNTPPVADAGPDQVVEAGVPVALDGRASADPDGDALSFAWAQLEGPAVALAGADSAQPRFTAPEVAAETALRFRLTATDAFGASDDDEVTVTVHPLPDYTGYVDPRIGSYPPGFTNPGPVVPFGMVGLGPDTEGPLNYGGYYFHNVLTTGFSHVHMSAGVFKGGYFPLLPFTGARTPGDMPGFTQASHPVPAYASAAEHATEIAEAGYYAVTLARYAVTAELTASERVGWHRYTFNDPAQAPRLLLDVSRNLKGYHAAAAQQHDAATIVGRAASGDGFTVFFALRLNAPFTVATFDGAPLPAEGSRLGLELDFAGLDGPLLAKLAISYVDEAGALANLEAEAPGWDFDAARAAARAKWRRALARIRVEGGNDAERTSFYTALYRLHHFPNLHSDVDGRYRGPDNLDPASAPHVDAARPHYSQFSSWDSYRGQNAMQAELFPDIYRDMVRSLLDFAQQNRDDNGRLGLPRWQQGPKDAAHMSGDPIMPFIGEAWCRGQLDAELRASLWPALTDLVERRDAELALKGYLSVPVPDHLINEIEGGSGRAGTTLEYGVADFSLALMAQTAAPDSASAIAQRSLNYRNLLDPETRWIRPRHADGAWLTPFLPELGYGFQEGTSWQYSWLAMHDYAALIDLMGGDAAVNDRLDLFFNFPAAQAPLAWPTIQNQATVFGVAYYGNQFAPGNEHDLEAPYVYNYAGAPWKTQAVARAAASIYTPTPNGLPGNDDLGALSGWLLWTMAGLYPVNPGTPLYVVGSPHFEKVTIKRPGGDLVIEAPGASPVNRFVTGMQVNGVDAPRSWLIVPQTATTVRLTTSPVPDMGWAADTAARPPSVTTAGLTEFGCGASAAPQGALRVDITPETVTLVSPLFERTWTRAPFRTARLVDARNGRIWSENSADFTLALNGVEIPSDRFQMLARPRVEQLDNGALRLTFTLAPLPASELPAGLRIERVVEAYPRIAGLRTQTWLHSDAPLVLSGYSLDEARPSGAGLAATIHSFRAGADWREPEWAGPPLTIGDPHAGSWRHSTSGASASGTAQWLSLADAADRRLFYVMERNDYASSMMSFDGARARAHVDLTRDIIYLGPIEESGHVENPGGPFGRVRAIVPGVPLRLEPVFTGFGTDGDDEPWQHYKYLAHFRMPPFAREVTFNSNNVDRNLISTGAKDDMDFAAVKQQAAIAKQIGVERFILDDGWQARSGDWCPDSPECPEPRWDGTPESKFRPRFPDASFSAVRAEIAPMQLGLWWTPMHFHPSAAAFNANPQWACYPISAALLAAHQADPDGGSNDAGVITWNPEALGSDGATRLIDYIEGRIRRAIDEWGVRYFKFDFTVWLDCAGVNTVDLYGYRESFITMLDRLLADHPDVTIQMDETNDYRLFPFEAIARGPTWYQNGSPTTNEALHANFLLAPFIPHYTLGRAALRASDLATHSADYQMQVALLSHITFFNNLAEMPAAAIPALRRWTDYYKAHRDDLTGLTYPLLADDPIDARQWAAFQVWNPEQGRGALLVYRQDAAEASRLIRLRNVPDGLYRLYQGPDEEMFADYSAEALRAGIVVTLPDLRTAQVLRIEKR